MKKLLLILFALLPLFASCGSQKQADGAARGAAEDFMLSDDDINGALPERVHIATRTQTFSRGYEFCLSDGKIMMKKTGADDWERFQGTGLPFPKRHFFRKPLRKEFTPPDEIVEIAADDDMLLAFDGDGKMFVCPLASNRVDKKFEWTDGFGWPEKNQLVKNALVKNSRGWATGTRRSSVEWYTDIFGNEHNWGTMGVTTVYFLSEDGREIRFTDSGLPTDLSDTLLGPERGSFIAENISASASTLFLIDSGGAMYTRLIDFDTMGSDPMFFKYTYIAEAQKYKGDDWRSNFTHWGLPNEDWKRQPDIPLSDAARLTKYICIFQNGKGNDARMLRVAGLSREGKTGFYYKGLTDDVWQFEEAPLQFSERAFLSGGAARGEKNEFVYRGVLMRDNKTIDGLECEIGDMTLTSEGSCTLALRYAGETKTIPLYLVEMWTYMTRYNPVFDGTPKSFFATPHFAESDIESTNEEFNKILGELFAGKNQELFAFRATASGPLLMFSFAEKQTGIQKQSAYTALLRTEHETLAAVNGNGDESAAAQNESVRALDINKTYTESDIPLLDSVIKENEAAIAEANEEMRAYLKDAAKSELSRWGYSIADTLASITMLNHVDVPKIKTMTSFGGELMTQNADNFKLMSAYKAYTNPYTIDMAENIIAECNALKAQIAAHGSAQTDALFRNSYADYFDALHIPQTTYGTVSYKKENYETTIARIDAPLPLLYMEYSDADGTQSVIIEFTSLIDDVKKQTQPFTANVVFRMISSGGSSFMKRGIRKYITSKSGTYTWDGNEARIEINKSGAKRVPLFISRRINRHL